MGSHLPSLFGFRSTLKLLTIPLHKRWETLFPDNKHYREKFTEYMVEVKAILDLYPDCFTNKVTTSLFWQNLGRITSKELGEVKTLS